jgi:hypothetical protein
MSMGQSKVSGVVAVILATTLAGCGGAEEIASPGSGGNVTINNPPPTIPNDPDPTPDTGLAVAADECPAIANPVGLNDEGTIEGPTGAYRVCSLPAQFTVSTTLPRVSGLLYALYGRVDVGPDRGAAPTGDPAVVLTIRPGVVVFAQTGTSWLAVNRGNRLEAAGTAAAPIVFTSRENVLGLTNDDSQGQWGGVVLLGRAPITDCTVAPAATPGSVNCERQTEGSVDPAYFGGATPNDNSGTIDYVQIRYSGYVLSGNSELQSLTLGGVGSGTKIDHFHSHNSSDDGFENFGGRANMRHVVVTGADDDTIDADTGYQGTIQYVLAVQKTSGAPDSMIELDSANALEDNTPRTFLKLANFTFVHRNLASGNNAAMLFRGKADATLVNGVVTSSMACLRLSGANILTADAPNQKIGPPLFNSVAMQCAGAGAFLGSSGVTNQQVSDVFTAGANNNAAFTSTLASTFVNGANETAVVAIDPKTVDAAFDTTTYAGAVKDANDTWYAGWTCNSGTANFGSTSTSCNSLPKL